MVGVEIDMVVSDSKKALLLYEGIFEIKRIDVTNYEKGLNEVIFSIYGTRFHLLDENPQYQLIAPKPGDTKPVWYNIVVSDIKETYDKAIAAGCNVIQPITELADRGIKNALFSDEFGYIWMLHEMQVS